MPTYLPYFIFHCNRKHTYMFIWPKKNNMCRVYQLAKSHQYIMNNLTLVVVVALGHNTLQFSMRLLTSCRLMMLKPV